MAGRRYSWQFTIPHGTAPAAPFFGDMAIDESVVAQIIVRVPPGPRGNVGFALWYGDGQVYPFELGAWLVADDTEITFHPAADLDAGSWQLVGYNGGTYDHTLYVDLEVVSPTAGQQTSPAVQPVYIG